jgi:hypothetical protein
MRQMVENHERSISCASARILHYTNASPYEKGDGFNPETDTRQGGGNVLSASLEPSEQESCGGGHAHRGS